MTRTGPMRNYRRFLTVRGMGIGDRVRLSDMGRRVLRGSAVRPGTVRGFGQRPDVIRVQRDGLKSIDSYHASFWEPLPIGSEP